MEIDKKNLLKYQEIYNYAYILSDGIFKIVFAEEKDHTLLISLVNAMLDLHDGDAIKEISLEMQEFPGVFCKKDCIVDIIGTTNAGEKVLVEVQQQGDDFYRDRVEYYTSRVIENQVHTSEKYELPRIYFLGLLDFTLFPEEPQKYIHHVDEMCNGRKFIKVIVKEEPVPEKIMQNATFRRLLDSVKLINFAEELFNCEVKNVTDLMAEHEIGFAEGKKEGFVQGKTEGHAEGFAEGKTEGREAGLAEGREAGLAEGREAGLAEGRAEGFVQGKTEGHAEGKTEGRAEGFAQGKIEGELKKAREMAAKMLAKIKPIEEIMEFTGLPESEILDIKSKFAH